MAASSQNQAVQIIVKNSRRWDEYRVPQLRKNFTV
jgi:hypothetical protein